ncbi:cellulase family glycosylhydrolase [Flavobacterium sp.]|uniref:cellulase family glycosylhydrolase n=1 Tax=Flavobacterium sp. TaxID=239 RepID=UPI001B3E4392|nr:cellulase family glycosylhydrolase [Flavobacterium sp.]MBP6182630.1 cellulase family glycosylhydrolase [Flavobacterium sp.]
MLKNKVVQVLLLIIFSLNILFSCKKDELPISNNSSQKYTTSGSKILFQAQPIQLLGANAFHVFSAGSTDMNSWNIDIAREFIGNIKETQLQGNPIKDTNGAYLYSLQSIIDSNRLNNRITIICGFGWDGKNETEFTGKSPATTAWWNDYKIKLKEWATYFKDQPDVWIEVWNEPYRYDRADGYTDAIWMNDMNEMVGIIRNTGNKNIILVPCAEQGQDETVLINKGNEFLANKSNIIYDIHAYEKWLLDNNTSINNRLEQLKLKNIPVIFGETAPMNAGVLMNPKSFLDIIYNRGLSLCAWTWKKDENDTDALLTATGLPNDNNNNNWGTTYKNLTTKVRNPQ